VTYASVCPLVKPRRARNDDIEFVEMLCVIVNEVGAQHG